MVTTHDQALQQGATPIQRQPVAPRQLQLQIAILQGIEVVDFQRLVAGGGTTQGGIEPPAIPAPE
ncbi:hypothetical protein OFN23_30695, partial [Escherichia coli]|nr:hypothetical protein [Escherichia coli]